MAFMKSCFSLFVAFLFILFPLANAEAISDHSRADSPNIIPDGPVLAESMLGGLEVNVSDNGNITVIKPQKAYPPMVTASDFNAADANNQCSNAQFFSYDSQYASGTIDPASDNDWWYVNIPSSGKLTVHMQGPSGADFDLYVHESCGSGWICRPYESDADETCVINARAGNYYFNIAGFKGTGSYRLDADLEKPDLVPGNIIVSPSSPNSGDNVVVRFYANNPSSVDVNSGFRYALYVDNSLQDYCDASGRKAGESKYCDSNAFKLSKGTHTLKVVVDSNHQISESDENNNEKTQQLTITGRYDLYPGDFTWTPSNPDTDSSIKITMRAGNYGPDDVDSSFDYKLYIDNEWWATCTASGRQAGQVGECDIDGIRLFSGTHTLKNVVDPDNDIHETNEGNNEGSTHLSVSGLGDLVPGDIIVSPSSPNSGDNVVVRFYANNPSAVDINSGFRYGLYVDNSLQDYCDASGRKAGESKYCDSNAFKLSKGTHTLKVVVDMNNNVRESNEGNNEKTQQLTITGRYDLYPGDFTWTPSNPDTDSSIKITMRAGNYGPDDVDSSFDYKLYIDNEWWATCTASGRQAGQVGECDIDGIRLFSGTHTLKNVVDPDNDIHETNENNNVKTQNLQVSSKTSYDLIPDGMTVSPSNPKNSDSIKVTYWAKNIGNTDITSSFRYGLYVDGVLKDYCTASGRKAGESKYCASDPLSLSAGGHTLKVVVDIDNDIPETREDNNEQTQILHVENADYVDLTPTDFEISPSNPRDNDLISITFQVTNTGTKPSGTFKSKLYIDNVLVHTCNLDSPVQPGSVWYCTHKRFLSAGSHTLKNSVDTENSVQESNEGNNVGYYNLDVSRNSCPIPDGSSSDCDCNSNADCPPSHPFCEENYPSPIRDGWDGCLASEPDYCGNGKCVGSENYNNCYVDCGQYAQKGSINVDVFYNSGPKSSSPIQNANVYLDDSFQGLTDLNGRKSFQASYGTRTVKVTCPDGVFCNSRSINVDGVKYASFGCPCSLPGDRDNDGIMDNDEVLIGSDPNNANSNLQSVWGTKSSDVLACLPTGAVLLVIWKKNIDNNGDWIQANDKVVAALNVTKVTSANIQEKPFLVAEAISSAGLDADIVVNKSYTLEQSAKTAERMDAVITHDGTLIIATDRESRTTTITSIGAMCSGAFAGSAWGIGQGVYDDVSGLFGAGKAIVTGLWFVVTSKDRFNKIGPGINDLITSVKVLLSKPGEAVWGIFRSTLEKGRIINPWREDRFNNRDSYVDFQIGFFSGFIQGYVVEQVFGMAVGIGVVSVAVKSGKLFAIFGKVSELSKKLVIIRDAANLGAEVAEKMSQLRYINAAVKWGDEELNALGRMMKLDEGWTKGLSEAEAKLAASRISKLSGKGISDGTIEKLVKSNVGKNTLKASEYSDELISKQAKLVEAIGSEGIDSVASRFDGFWPWQKDGWKKVNSFINELPEGSITSTTKKEAMINIIASSDFEVIVDSLRNLKGTEGLQDAVKAVLDTQQDTRKIADNIVKANELKQSGRTIESLEKPFYYPNGNLKGQFDIVYKKSGGETIYMEHKMRDWPTIENRAISDDMIDQMRRYNEEVGNWDQIRLSSRTSMPNWLIENLKKGLGSDVVQKILRGD